MSKEESFVLQFAPKNEQENYLNITTATTTITTTDSEPVISQKSMHLFSQPHRTSVSVIQFTNEGDSSFETSVKKGKTLVFRKPLRHHPRTHSTEVPLTSLIADSPPTESSALPVKPDQIVCEPLIKNSDSKCDNELQKENEPEPQLPQPNEYIPIETGVQPSKENKRIISTLQALIHKDLDKKDNKCLQLLYNPDSSCIKYPNILEPLKMSEVLKKGYRLGRFISFMFLLPVLPHILGCLWLCIELAVAMALLILSLITIKDTPGVFVPVSLTMTVTMVVLACFDAIFFLSSCGCCNYARINTDRFLPATWFKKYGKIYEIIRTIASELLLYPLVVVCLPELLNDGVFNIEHKIVFSIFFISCAYIVLSVYVIRPLLVIVTIVRLQAITSGTSDYLKYFVRFLLHIFAQVLVHILCIVSVGIKIKLGENKTPNTYMASPFLWIVIITSWMIPLMGTLSFLILNFHWLENLYFCQFIHIVEYLEKPEYIKAVYLSDTHNNSVDNSYAKQFLQDVQYYSIKQQYNSRLRQTNIVAKLIYPSKVFLYLLYCVCFDLAYVGFIIGFYDSINFTSPDGIIVFVAIISIAVCNFHFLLFTNIWLLIVIFGGFILIPVLIVLLIIKKCCCGQSGYSNFN